MRRSSRRLIETLLVVAAGALAVWVWWRDRIEGHVHVFDLNILNYDSYAYYEPTFHYAFQQLRRGDFPFWNPFQLCGTPFFAHAQHLLLYPLNVLYLLLPTPAAMKGTAIGHLVLAFGSTFLLARLLALSAMAAVTAAAAFTFCSTTTGLVYLPHHLYGAAWIPLVLALTELVLTRVRRCLGALALGLVLAAQYLGGYPMFSLFSLYLIGARLAWWLVWEGGLRSARDILGVATALTAAGLVVAVLAGVQLAAATELTRISPRHFSALSAQAADPTAGLGIFKPWLILRDLALPAVGRVFPPSVGIGTLGLALAGVGLLHRQQRVHVALFLVVAIGAFVLGLGAVTPAYEVYFALPTGNWFRQPRRFLFLTSFALAMLAGFGVDWLERRRLPRLLIMLLPAGVYVELFFVFVNVMPLPETHPDFLALPPDVVRVVQEREGGSRTYLAIPRLGTTAGFPRVPPKAGMLYGLHSISDRENLFSERFAAWAAFMEDGGEPSPVRLPQGEIEVHADSDNVGLLDLMSTRLIVENPPGQFVRGPPNARFPLVYAGGPFRVYENPTALPRAYVVERAEVIGRPREVLERLARPDFPRTTAVVLEEEPGPVGSSPGAAAEPSPGARIVIDEAGRVRIDAGTRRAGFLVLTDQYYPGWEATLDGTPVRVYRANYLFRAVALPAGAHVVEFRYVPTYLRWALD